MSEGKDVKKAPSKPAGPPAGPGGARKGSGSVPGAGPVAGGERGVEGGAGEDVGTSGSPEQVLRKNYKEDRENLYKPLVDHLRGIQKGALARERDIPMGRIARMQVAGLFLPPRHALLYEDVRDILLASKDYVELYWKLQNKIAREFDSQMKRDGIHATVQKEYVSLKSTVSEAVIMNNGKYWSLSYDTYIPKLRETARKTSVKPRSGEEMFRDLSELFAPELKKLTILQKNTRIKGRKLEKKVKAIRWNSPEYEPGL